MTLDHLLIMANLCMVLFGCGVSVAAQRGKEAAGGNYNNNNNNNIHHRGRMEGTDIRLKFLGGFEDTNDALSHDMCYQYQLYLRNDRNTDADRGSQTNTNTNTKSVTWSLQICDGFEMDSDSVSNVLKSVEMGDPRDNYYVDDTHFYYQAIDIFDSINNNIVTLCFHNINSDTAGTRLISKTQFCIINQNLESICSDRSVFVTDVCNANSLARSNFELPPTDIDYVPQTNKVYDILEESKHDKYHGGDLFVGSGTFELNPDLVVLRAWWIDECHILNTTLNNIEKKTIEITLNDNIFNVNATNLSMGEYSSNLFKVGAPVTLPIYDLYLVETECKKINGYVTEYVHDADNEEIILYIESTASPLIFFKDIHVDTPKMRLLNLENQKQRSNSRPTSSSSRFSSRSSSGSDTVSESETVDTTETHRRRLSEYYTKWTKELEGSVSFDSKVSYHDYDLATCKAVLASSVTFGVGLYLEYSWWSLLEHIETSFSIDAGFNAYLKCVFGDDYTDNDKTIDANILSLSLASVSTCVPMGPVCIILTPFIDLDVDITRPAVGISVFSEVNIGGGITFVTGWSEDYYYNNGFYSYIKNYLSVDYVEPTVTIDNPFDNNDKSLDLGLRFVVKPGIMFGTILFDFFYVAAPLSVPQITATIDWNENSDSDSTICTSLEDKIDVNIDFDFEAEIEIGFPGFDFFGIGIIEEKSWSFQYSNWNYHITDWSKKICV